MQIHKPYKPKPPAPAVSPATQDSINKPADQEQTAPDKMNQPLPLPPGIPVAATAVFPVPPPNMLYLYQMMSPMGPMGPPRPIPPMLPPGELVPGGPLSGLPGVIPPTGTPVPPPKTTKPRVVHEYFDTLAMQWREFNPEGYVVGDETDPFIVYFRYGNKSIGARRTPWILPKHIKLVKIMQDCLPDFDWRNGEDLLVIRFAGDC